MHLKIMNLKLLKNLLRPSFSSKLETTLAYVLSSFCKVIKIVMDWRQRKTTQKKKDWKMGGLIEVDGNDDNEEIAI